MYTTLNKLLKVLTKHDIIIVMGYSNSKLGEGHSSGIVWPFGQGEINKRGDTLEVFVSQNISRG